MPKPVRILGLAAVAVAGLILAGCHGHLKHGHVPPGQAKKVISHDLDDRTARAERHDSSLVRLFGI